MPSVITSAGEKWVVMEFSFLVGGVPTTGVVQLTAGTHLTGANLGTVIDRTETVARLLARAILAEPGFSLVSARVYFQADSALTGI